MPRAECDVAASLASLLAEDSCCVTEKQRQAAGKAAAVKKKIDEEKAAAKKKAEEKSAKKKAKEEAAAKKKAEEKSAAKKQAEQNEAAAKKKAEENATKKKAKEDKAAAAAATKAAEMYADFTAAHMSELAATDTHQTAAAKKMHVALSGGDSSINPKSDKTYSAPRSMMRLGHDGASWGYYTDMQTKYIVSLPPCVSGYKT